MILSLCRRNTLLNLRLCICTTHHAMSISNSTHQIACTHTKSACTPTSNHIIAGVPNGGAIVDCCGICNGFNANLDYCGYIAGICFEGGTPPANVPCPPGAPPDKCPVSRRIPNNLVCHTVGNSPKVNRSCTGCDGVPRPDLPWNPAPESFNMGMGVGGTRNDSCGVCGG